MPPKKKKGKGKKGKKGKKKDVAKEEDKFKKTVREIEILKEHLAHRNEIARRSQAQASDWKNRLHEMEENLEEQKLEQKDVSAELTRQYKTMHTDMDIRMRELNTEVEHLRQQVANARQELETTKREKEEMEQEKNETIRILEKRIDEMEISYEGVLTASLDSLIGKIDEAKDKWDQEGIKIQEQTKITLLEFGLNPLDI
ncbi:dynein regulatory complex protein 12-like [Styela clava]